ncbi:MAG: 23S rRNA (adenine(2503)-C(2))-methyltransferase RlmN, partial [Anaerolineales bacterium]|nr:23S rRNA (adenine(2503)-C(2))-methyltransferase RlmN [Anaerolineales bacterium]
MSLEKISLYDLSYEKVIDYIVELGEPKFRAQQVWNWLYNKYVTEFAEMRNLPKSLIEKLEANAVIHSATIASEQHSSDGRTKKVL